MIVETVAVPVVESEQLSHESMTKDAREAQSSLLPEMERISEEDPKSESSKDFEKTYVMKSHKNSSKRK